MSTKVEGYFRQHDLFDDNKLKDKCDRDGVQIITSQKYPGLVMLHYDTKSVHFANKWTTFNKMCRGLIIDLKSKSVLVHPFNKFFNLDEQPETNLNVLLELGEFEVAEKLDGSMIIIFKDPNTGKYVATTKGSFDSEHGEYATSLIPDRLKDDIVHKNYSLIFELIDKRFQIVVNYEKKGYKPGLYLIGARHRYTNKLIPFSGVKLLANELGVPCPNVYEFQTLPTVIQKAKQLPVLEEGYVIRFKKDGRLVKLKGDEYLYAHRFISKLSPKAIIEALGEGIGKELADSAPEEYREDIINTIADFQKKRKMLVDECYEKFHEAPKNDRKTYALWVNKNIPSDIRGVMFSLLDNKPIDDKKVYRVIGIREGVSGDTRI